MTLSSHFLVRFLACGVLLLTPVIRAWAQGQQAAIAEETPVSLPGAESFIYRDGTNPVRLFVFKPKDWAATDRRPALMFFFGGGWTTGTPRNAATWSELAASLGLVGIAPDYRTRGRSDVSPLESVDDSRAALRWVQNHAGELGIDPGRIVVGGNSAGGHLALWTAISHSPPGSDPATAPRLKPAALILMSSVSDTSAPTGYTPQRFGEHATDLSALHQLDATMPPVLAFHGDADRTVPFRQALALRERLLAAGNSCELIVVPGGDHGFMGQMPGWFEKSRTVIGEFLGRQGLLPGPTPGR